VSVQGSAEPLPRRATPHPPHRHSPWSPG